MYILDNELRAVFSGLQKFLETHRDDAIQAIGTIAMLATLKQSHALGKLAIEQCFARPINGGRMGKALLNSVERIFDLFPPCVNPKHDELLQQNNDGGITFGDETPLKKNLLQQLKAVPPLEKEELPEQLRRLNAALIILNKEKPVVYADARCLFNNFDNSEIIELALAYLTMIVQLDTIATQESCIEATLAYLFPVHNDQFRTGNRDEYDAERALSTLHGFVAKILAQFEIKPAEETPNS